jgi:hypothetical protein
MFLKREAIVMGTQSRTSFKKRQKELARQEKQRDKAARRLERKHAPKSPGGFVIEGIEGEGIELMESVESLSPPSLPAEE